MKKVILLGIQKHLVGTLEESSSAFGVSEDESCMVTELCGILLHRVGWDKSSAPNSVVFCGSEHIPIVVLLQ